jgi:hypothetical protein
MESILKIIRKNLCNEVNAKSENNIKKISPFSYELKSFTRENQTSFFGKYDTLLSK